MVVSICCRPGRIDSPPSHIELPHLARSRPSSSRLCKISIVLVVLLVILVNAGKHFRDYCLVQPAIITNRRRCSTRIKPIFY